MASVSFVCPLFNKAAYLPGVIDALTRQAPSHEREFIFIDDGSSDGSLELVQSLTRGWPNCTYRHQANQGPSGATNAGIALASGNYLKLVGSDDILAPFATDVLLRALRQTGAVAVYSRQDYYTDPAAIVFDEARAAAAEAEMLPDAIGAVIAQAISGTSQTLYRTDAVKRGGACDSRVFAEDYSLALRLALQGDIAMMDLVTAYGPAGVGERIMVGRKHQVFHDYNLALLLFFRDQPDLKLPYGRLALRRAAGRAEKWVRREGDGQSPLPYALLRLLSYLPGLDHARLIGATLPAFAAGPMARRMGIIRPAAV